MTISIEVKSKDRPIFEQVRTGVLVLETRLHVDASTICCSSVRVHRYRAAAE